MNLGICIGIETPDSDWTAIDSLNELKELANTAGITIQSTMFQNVKNQINYPTLEKENLLNSKTLFN